MVLLSKQCWGSYIILHDLLNTFYPPVARPTPSRGGTGSRYVVSKFDLHSSIILDDQRSRTHSLAAICIVRNYDPFDRN